MLLIIRRNKGKFFVNQVGKNGSALNETKSFTQKPSAWTNVKAQAHTFGKGAIAIVQDHSIDGEVTMYKVHGTGKIREIDAKPRKINFSKFGGKDRGSKLEGRKYGKAKAKKKARVFKKRGKQTKSDKKHGRR